jgi:hypothetical protein
MELGMDYAELAANLGKRQIKPTIPELEELKAKVSILESQVTMLMKENNELQQRLKLAYSKENVAGYITPSILETENPSDKYLTEGLLNKNIPWEQKHNLYLVEEANAKMEELKNEQNEQREWSEIERI